MARIGDPQYLVRLTEILQTRDPIALPDTIDPSSVGITIAIAAEDVLQLAGRRKSTPLTLRSIADPAAGAHWSVTVPQGEVWKLLAITYRFVSSANPGTRIFGHVVDEGLLGGLYLPWISEQVRSTGIGPGVTADLAYYRAARVAFANAGENLASNDAGAGATILGPLPDVLLNGGYRLRSAAFAGGPLVAGDQFSRIRILYELFRS